MSQDPTDLLRQRPGFHAFLPVLFAVDPVTAPAGPSLLESLLPVIAIVVIFYFLLIRPQSQEKAKHEQMVQALKRDDRVVMSSGLHGKIAEVDETTVTLEVPGKNRLVFEKGSVAKVIADSAAGTPAGK